MALREHVLDDIGVDHVVVGEVEHCIGDVLDRIYSDSGRVIRSIGHPRVNDIP